MTKQTPAPVQGQASGDILGNHPVWFRCATLLAVVLTAGFQVLFKWSLAVFIRHMIMETNVGEEIENESSAFWSVILLDSLEVGPIFVLMFGFAAALSLSLTLLHAFADWHSQVTKNGKWGAVDARDNRELTEFGFDSYKDIDLMSLD